jgi:hypothetical protein
MPFISFQETDFTAKRWRRGSKCSIMALLNIMDIMNIMGKPSYFIVVEDLDDALSACIWLFPSSPSPSSKRVKKIHAFSRVLKN